VRFASCRYDDERFAALVEGDRVTPLDGVEELGRATDIDLLRSPPLSRGSDLDLDEVELFPVVPRPGKIVCLGHNYRGHVSETKSDLPTYPVLFTKFAESLVGPYAPIVKPPESRRMDFEVELAVIIGRRVRRARGQAALQAVAGLCVANDVTMRDYQHKTRQWLQGKSWAGSTPRGRFW
jgi:acylpyruvate hydrolase